MIPATILARRLAARRAAARRKPPRPRLPNQAERLYVGMLRRYAARFEELVRSALADTEWASLVRSDARRPGPMGFVSRASVVLDGVKVRLLREAGQLPIEQIGHATAKSAVGQVVRVLGIRANQVTTEHAVIAWRERSVNLITEMTKQQLDQVADILNQFDGLHPFDLAGKLQEFFDMTRARSELIARDQVLKLNAGITQDAHRQAGIDEYEWSSSGDQSVRDMHADLDGTVHSWDDPPVTNPQGERNHPGQDYECRCVAIPRLPELEG
jgi:SPP1 gp7 family putative phage head morphogenesis protein